MDATVSGRERVTASSTQDVKGSYNSAAAGMTTEAAMAAASAAAPGGLEKLGKYGAKIGGKVLAKVGSTVANVAKRIDCADPNVVFRTVGNALGKCFVGDTEIVLDFAEDGTTLALADAKLTALGLPRRALGAFPLTLSVGGIVLAERKEREFVGELALQVAGDRRINRAVDATGRRAEMHRPCDRLFHDAVDGELEQAEPGMETLPVPTESVNSRPQETVMNRPLPTIRSQSNRRARRRGFVDGRLVGLWLLCLTAMVGGAWLLFGGAGAERRTEASGGVAVREAAYPTSATVCGKYVTQKIWDLQVPTWVLADNPETEGNEGFDYSQLDPNDLRVLRVVMPKPDGGVLRLQMLWHREDLEAEEVGVGSLVPLDYEELGIEGEGEVLKILPCLKILA